MKRPIVLHFHIFKNAGMTFGWILENNFGKDHVRMDDDANKILRPQTVNRFLLENPSVKAFSCHIMDNSITNIDEITFLKLIFIRHPVDRACSIYNYNKKVNTVNSIATTNAKKMNLEEYIDWNLTSRRGHMEDPQTKSLTGYTSRDIESAIKNMKETEIVGIVDRFDESMVVAEEFLKEYFSEIDFSYVAQNVTSKPNAPIIEKVKEEKQKMGNKVYEKFIQANLNDETLYKEGNLELDNRIKNIIDFDKKLNDFKKRCLDKKNISVPKSVLKFPRLWYSSEKNSWYYKGWVNKNLQFFTS
jgi:hypothetical protein